MQDEHREKIHEHVYPVPGSMGMLVFVLNIIFPGFGTMIQSYYHKDGCSVSTWLIGLMQSILAICIVGWIWSIYHGYHVWLVSEAAKLLEGVVVAEEIKPDEEQTPLVEE